MAAPTLDGARHLLDAPLDFVWLFWSITSLHDGAGQANYAASDVVLDALAPHRGRPALLAFAAVRSRYVSSTASVANR